MTRRARSVVLLALVCGCTPSLTEVELELGATQTTAVDLPPGPVSFSMQIASYRYDQAQDVLLTVEALRDGSVKASVVACHAFMINNHPTRGSRSNNSHQRAADCWLTIPKGGADELRFATSLDAGTATMEGMRVFVREGKPVGADLIDGVETRVEELLN